MPSTAKPNAGSTIAARSRRKPRRRAPGDATNRRSDEATPAPGGATHGVTIALLQEVVAILQGRATVYQRGDPAAENSATPLGDAVVQGLAAEDLTHSRWLAERIAELGGTTQWGPGHEDPAGAQAGWLGDKPPLQADTPLADAVVDRVGCLLTLVGENDLTTKFLIEDILFDELERYKERREWLAK